MTEQQQVKPKGAGKSSFDLVDSEAVFEALGLGPGKTLLDVACGPGHYSLAASKIVGREGQVFGLDLWKEGIDALKTRVREERIRNLEPSVTDVTRLIPFTDGRIGLCLIATVLHDLVEIGGAESTLAEVARVIRPGGRLAVVEFKKIDGPPGPPIEIRLAPDEAERIVTPAGFEKIEERDVGPFTYLLVFERRRDS